MTGISASFRVLHLVLAALLLLSPLSADEPAGAPVRRDLALGAKYTLWPQPNYSHCTDPDDLRQLTDGKTTKDYFWTQKGTVGWSGAPYATVNVDLGRVEPIGGVSLTTAAGVAGVLWPSSIPILVSDDGKQYRQVGDLAALDQKAQGSWPKGYAIRRLETSELHTRGRYVQFMIIPLAGCPFIFTDEVEVFRGPDSLLAADPGGKPIGSVEQIFQRGRIQRGVEHRIQSDVRSFQELLRGAKAPGGEEVRTELLQQAEAIGRQVNASQFADVPNFRAVLPFGDQHAKLFALQAQWWRTFSRGPLVVSPARTWDPCELFVAPPDNSAPLAVHVMRNEHRAAAFNVFDATDQPVSLRVTFEGLPGSPTPGYVTVHAVQWTDTSQGVAVGSALPEAKRSEGAWEVSAMPGLVRQVWLTFHPVDLSPGNYSGQIVVRSGAIERRLPLRVKVWPLDFPKRTTLLLGGWDYMDGNTYGVTPKNRQAFLKHLKDHFVNAPWAGGGTMLGCTFPDGDPAKVRIDTSRFDAWQAQWPEAARYMVFLAVGDSFAGKKCGTPEFNQCVAAWISAWVKHLATKCIGPERLGVLIHDEPSEGTDVGPVVAWARAIRAAEPRVLVWEDPTYQDPRKAPPEFFDVCHVLCPNRPMWLEHGKPFAEFYLEQQRKGRELQFYSCSGPAKLLDPYSYYRLQAWHGWAVGATGSFFWAFGDNSGASSWNEYLATAGPYTPLFLDSETVTAGKQMEAIRESVEDYEYLVMLRAAVDRAKRAGRNDAPVGRADWLLKTVAHKVLAAPGADRIFWKDSKDRSAADVARVRILEAFADLEGREE